MSRKNTTTADEFWQEYEARIQEKVLARSMGRYVSGWDEYPMPLWGLLIATSGGFRFHHFPQESWLSALGRFGGEKTPKEKTFFIPREQILSVELRCEKSWWKKLLAPHPPLLALRYQSSAGAESAIIAETDQDALAVRDALQGLIPPRGPSMPAAPAAVAPS